jgi:FtsP/CotA-like multicopper oxidase with cupredoxin domain
MLSSFSALARRCVAPLQLFAAASCVLLSLGAAPSPAPAGHVRNYYIAAEEIDWNYMPTGKDQMMGMSPMGYAKFFMTSGPGLIGSVYRKAVYREYTDATFTKRKPRPASEAYLGILGPTIYAEVGDTIHVVFRNKGTHPYSMHPHGVLYTKANEGSLYADGVPTAQKTGDVVLPGHTYTYVWDVVDRSGPGPNDGSSVVWAYHSHVDERRDVNSGLIGAIVITKAGMAREDGTPKDVDHGFVTLFMIFDENHSWFINENVRRFVKKHVKGERLAGPPIDPDGNADPVIGTGMLNQNFRSTINGYQYANMPPPVMKVGDHVRWYVMSMGIGFNVHTPHWHGNTVLFNGLRTDSILIGPSQSLVADMVPDAPGTWLFHCHMSDHMEAGMVADYMVQP